MNFTGNMDTLGSNMQRSPDYHVLIIIIIIIQVKISKCMDPHFQVSTPLYVFLNLPKKLA